MSIETLVNEQRKYFKKSKTYDIQFRIDELSKLKKAILSNEKMICDALKKDLNKSSFEGYMTEIGMVLEEISYAQKHLKSWSKKRRVKTPIAQFYSQSYICPEPYGVVLILSPWNYPFYLSLAPLVGAIAAGNCAVIKPSAYSKNMSNILKNLISEIFDENYIAVITGGREENKRLLDLKFDYIFFTGSKRVGQIVMEKASKHLTPVTLELGGKSPCIITESADLYTSAKRVVFGKILNAGQTCVAPDYILADKKIKDKFITYVKQVMDEFMPENEYENMPKIINAKHFDRILNLLENEEIIFGGKIDKDKETVYPVLVDNVLWESKLMSEELFAPIIPIIAFDNIDEIIEKINQRDKPLALYLFTNDNEIERKILSSVSFGGGCINDTIIHLSTPYMPFGGVGSSGMGGYHGKYSFDTFTHYKSVLKKSFLIDLPMRYHPYSESKFKLIRKFLK